MELPSPKQLKNEYPLRAQNFIADARQTAKNILQRKDKRLILIVGPCSIHDIDSALEYAFRLKRLMPEIESTFFPIMRVFIEKPRSKLGWKGMLYDPHLNESNDIATGLRRSREILLKITELGIPCATEILEPISAIYFDDLITWGLIGARTSASQPHRQMASGLSFPIGFKNDCQGGLSVALEGILTARMPHSHIGIDDNGKVSATQTLGNHFSHLVLRGSNTDTNFDPISVEKGLDALCQHRLEPRLLIDCSHGNSGKDHSKQKTAFQSIMEQTAYNPSIIGLMLESNLYAGKQPLKERPLLSYGVSITDPCIGWEETESLLLSFSKSISISSVQK